MNQAPNRTPTNSRQGTEATKKLKRRMIIVLICMVVFAAVALPLLSYLETLETQGSSKPVETKKDSTIIPYEPDWDLDIMKDAGYLSMNRTVYYCDARYGMTEVMDEKTKDKFGPAAALLYRMIGLIIKGDHEGYNALFSSNYYNTDGNEPEAPFTMQQLYDIKITLLKQSEKKEGGKSYVQYEFEVEYRIRMNNSTFRHDIGSDESKKQYFVLSDSTSSEVLIDQILDYVYKS